MKRRFVWSPTLSMLGLLVAVQSGCASGGRRWVSEAPPLEASHRTGVGSSESRKNASNELEESDLEGTSAEPVARRRVITLGERTESSEEPSAAGPAAAGTTIVQVNVTTQPWLAPVWGYGYPGYGVGRPGLGWGGVRPERPDHPDHCDPSGGPPSGPPATPSTAGDWARPPDHGPPPISQTLPGNPWH